MWFLISFCLGLTIWPLILMFLCQIGQSSGNCPFFSYDFITVIVAIGFWATGLFVFLKKQSFVEVIFFLWGAGALSTGMVAGTDDNIGIVSFFICLVFYAPIIFQFYLVFLKRPQRMIERSSLIIMYFLAAFVSLAFIYIFITLPHPNPTYNLLKSSNRLGFVSAIIWTIYILTQDYLHFSTLAARRQIRLMAIGVSQALMPLILLTVIPQALGINYVNAAITFPWLLLIPLLYLYSTFRTHLGFAESTFRAILVYFLIGVVFVCIFMIATEIETLIPIEDLQSKVIIGSSILLVVAFMPLRKRLYAWIDWAFYGSETDYQASLLYLEGLFANVLDRNLLIHLLVDELLAAIKPANIILFLKQKNHSLTFAASKGLQDNVFLNIQFENNSPLLLVLVRSTEPISTTDLQKLITHDRRTANESVLLESSHVALWIPLVSDEVLQGLILLSLRPGDDLYTEKDKKLLSDIISIAGSAIRNIILAEDILSSREELVRAHYQLITQQEEERKRIARELHDDTIQQMLGINFHLAEIKNQFASVFSDSNFSNRHLLNDIDNTRDQIIDSVAGIRKMINELRPAGLDEFGIRTTLENMAVQFRQKNRSGYPELFLYIDPEVDNIPDIQSICIYRISQEAIRNISKHANATYVTIKLFIQLNQIVLDIKDDGNGFEVPDRLSELALFNHFGLIGIAERAQSIGGKTIISSQPGTGTQIITTLPRN